MKMPNWRRMLPGQKRGMGTTAKVLLITLPVAAFIAAKMLGTHMENDEENW